MSKFKIRRKKTPQQLVREEARKINWKLWGITLLTVALIFAVYQVAVHLGFVYIIHIYSIAAAGLAIAYFILNRGLSGHKVRIEDLPEGWEPERKAAFIEKAQKRHGIAKKLLIPIIGIMLTFAYDIVYLTYIEPLL